MSDQGLTLKLFLVASSLATTTGSLLGTVDNVLQTVIPDGFTKGTYVGGKLYYKSFPNDRKPYYKAEKHCNSLGGHLATFRTDIEYNYVKGKRTTDFNDDIWIGLENADFVICDGHSTDGDCDNKFYWIDDASRAVTRATWQSSDANEGLSCIRMLANGRMGDKNCLDHKGYICQFDPDNPVDPDPNFDCLPPGYDADNQRYWPKAKVFTDNNLNSGWKRLHEAQTHCSHRGWNLMQIKTVEDLYHARRLRALLSQDLWIGIADMSKTNTCEDKTSCGNVARNIDGSLFKNEPWFTLEMAISIKTQKNCFLMGPPPHYKLNAVACVAALYNPFVCEFRCQADVERCWDPNAEYVNLFSNLYLITHDYKTFEEGKTYCQGKSGFQPNFRTELEYYGMQTVNSFTAMFYVGLQPMIPGLTCDSKEVCSGKLAWANDSSAFHSEPYMVHGLKLVNGNHQCFEFRDFTDLIGDADCNIVKPTICQKNCEPVKTCPFTAPPTPSSYSVSPKTSLTSLYQGSMLRFGFMADFIN